MASTGFLKVGIICLILVFILHAVGIGTPKWAIYEILGGLSSYHTGLWQICFSVLGFGGCSVRTLDEAIWFRAAQILEAVGALGLFVSGIISLVMACSQHGKSLKAINIVILMGSGVCIVVGVIVFAVELSNPFYEIFSLADIPNVGDDKLGYSFFLSAVAGGLCLILCVPLFIMDYRAAATQPAQQLPVQSTTQERVIVTSKHQPQQQYPVHYSSNSSRVTVSSTNQPAPVHYSNQVIQSNRYHQPHGNMPAYAHNQPAYYVTQHPSFERMPTHGVW